MADHSARTRLLMGAGFAASLALASGCSSAASSATTTITAAPPVTMVVTTTTTTTAVPATTGAPTTTLAPDGRLQHALDVLGPNYHFTTVATVGGTVALTADGDRVGSGSRLTLTASNGTVAYVITAKGSWAKPENGEWAALDTAPATADPITSLRHPKQVVVRSSKGSTVTLVVTIANADLGIAGAGDAAVTIELVGGKVHTVAYSTKASGQQATVVATIGAVKDASAVVAPI